MRKGGGVDRNPLVIGLTEDRDIRVVETIREGQTTYRGR